MNIVGHRLTKSIFVGNIHASMGFAENSRSFSPTVDIGRTLSKWSKMLTRQNSTHRIALGRTLLNLVEDGPKQSSLDAVRRPSLALVEDRRNSSHPIGLVLRQSSFLVESNLFEESPF